MYTLHNSRIAALRYARGVSYSFHAGYNHGRYIRAGLSLRPRHACDKMGPLRRDWILEFEF